MINDAAAEQRNGNRLPWWEVALMVAIVNCIEAEVAAALPISI
jgi:hypothetical protein